MGKRLLSLALASILLAWSSGFLLSVHLHEAGPEHNSHHCEQCLLMSARTPALVADGPELVTADQISWSVPAEPRLVVLVRAPHLAFTSRAPPAT